MKQRRAVLDCTRLAGSAAIALLLILLFTAPAQARWDTKGPWATASQPAGMAVAPHVPPAIGRRVPAEVTIRLEAARREVKLAPGLTYDGITFGTDLPGPMFRVFEGDAVELQFSNPPDSPTSCRIEIEPPPVTGATRLASPVAAPGETRTLSFKASRPGLYLYRAGDAGSDVPSAGASGLILVQPTYGFAPADREYFIVQNEFFENAGSRNPSHLLFNGRLDALAGDQALAGRPGERIRLFVGNAGSQFDASLGVSGHPLATLDEPDGEQKETASLSAGSTAILEWVFDEAGEYELTDRSHSSSGLQRSSAKIVVSGEPVLSASEAPIQLAAAGAAAASAAGTSAEMTPELQEKISAGEQVYNRTCVACHQPTGVGIPMVYPPLAESDYLVEDLDRAIKGVIKGQMGEMIVKGQKYNMLMPAQQLNDEEIAQVLTYVLNSFGNPGGEIGVERVKEVRAAAK